MALTKNVDLNVTFTLTSPNIIVTQPDGTIYSAVASISPSGTSPTGQKFTAMFVPTMGGLHQGRFQGIVSGQTVNFTFIFFVPWTDVFSVARNLLGTNIQQMPDCKLDYEYANLVLKMATYAGQGLVPYYQFTTTYQQGFDQGGAKLLASTVRPYIGGKRPTGEVLLFKKGTTQVNYSPGAKQEFTLEKLWWDQGMETLESNIPEIRCAAAKDRAGDETMSRGDLARGNFHPLAGWIVLPGGGRGFSLNGVWDYYGGFAGWGDNFGGEGGSEM